jgi:hypothetical protein
MELPIMMRALSRSLTRVCGRRVAALSPLAALLLAASPLRADDHSPPFDFADTFYRQNGVDPDKIVGRPNGQDGNSIVDHTDDPTRRDIRMLQTVTGWDDSGHGIYFTIQGVLFPDAFTQDQAGTDARNLGNASPFYIFPRASNPPFTVFPKRQDDLGDLRHGYFSNNVLGVWSLVFVRFTPAAFDTPAGRAALAELAARNGVDLDGTPLLKTGDEIESLADDGFVSLERPNQDGSQGPVWFLCPVIKDPREGAIAPDAFLELVRDDRGAPLTSQASLLSQFTCLQATHDFCAEDARAQSFGSGWPGTIGTPSLGASAAPVICSTIDAIVTNSSGATTAAILLVGAGRASIPTTLGGTILVAPPWTIFSLVLPADGATIPAPIPCDAALVGVSVDLQVLESDAGASAGVSFTPGLELLLGG